MHRDDVVGLADGRTASSTATMPPAAPTPIPSPTLSDEPTTVDGPTRSNRFRDDIEGLRAVAVILVFLDHLWSQPRGGFVGVDVFFVISGYLITSLLLSESERRGRISFTRFYERRAKRILPAAITVLIASVVAAQLTFTSERVKETITDVWWALGFGANIHFADIGTDYFQADRPPSLVQHFWSLAVEEQFYVVWPIVMMIVLTVIGRRLSKTSREGVLLAVLSAGTLASFGWAIHQTSSNPAAAYFSTPVRAWELGIGAMIAVALTRFPDAAKRLGLASGPLVLIGLLGVVLSGFVVSATNGFPAPGAVLPVLSTALVIAAGASGPSGLWSIALTNPVSRYVGRISYSLYLWHWPVIVIALALMPAKPAAFYVVVLAIAFGLSIASYHFVEAPIRAFKFRAAEKAVSDAPRDSSEWTRRLSIAFACIALLTIGLAAYTFKPRDAPQPFLAQSDSKVAAVPADPGANVPSPALGTAITAAVSATTWPKLSPPLSQLTLTSAHTEWLPCNGATVKTLKKCTFGAAHAPPAKTAVVLGDSYALAWMPAIEAALVPAGWKIYGLMLTECPAVDISVNDTSSPPKSMPACDAQHKFALAEAVKLNPGLVILASSAQTLTRLHSGVTGTAAMDEYQAAMVKTIHALGPSASRRIVTLSAPPNTPSIQTCDTKGSGPAKCVGTINAITKSAAVAERAAAAATKTKFVNTNLWFCTSAGYCPSFVGTTPVRWDGNHLTDAYAKKLGPELAAALKG